MKARETTLKAATEQIAQKEHHFRASDFLSDAQQEQLQLNNRKSEAKKKPYDEIDAFAAELLARFGWEAYQAWQRGEFEHKKALRFIAAERARETRALLPLEAITFLSMAGANNVGKSGKPPKSLARAQQILNSEIKKG